MLTIEQFHDKKLADEYMEALREMLRQE